MDDLEHNIINLSRGENVVGLFGKVENETTYSMGGRAFTTKNFVSLGFILNQCDNYELS